MSPEPVTKSDTDVPIAHVLVKLEDILDAAERVIAADEAVIEQAIRGDSAFNYIGACNDRVDAIAAFRALRGGEV